MLTKRENQVLELTAHGFSADEIADKLYRSTETVKKTISNIKAKVGLQKATELTAYYWCRAFGECFEKRRNAIVSATFILLVIFTNPLDMQEARRPVSRPRTRIERQYKPKRI
jgi:DNA-binding CsgD family transcriptional regulator